MTHKPWTEEDVEALVSLLIDFEDDTQYGDAANEILSLLNERGMLKDK